MTTVAVVAMALPLAATAGADRGKSASSGSGNGNGFVAQQLLDKAKSNPGGKVSVIIQSTAGAADAEGKLKGLGSLKRKLGLIGAVAAELPAGKISKLAEKNPGLTITEDAGIEPLASTSTQLWTHEAGVNKLWNGPQAPTIAIVDSGIDSGRLDFLGRVTAEVSFVSSTSNTNTQGDGRGHGTFVAGIAAGNAPGFAGAAPNANIVSLDVMDDSGSGLTSDVIAAVEWIYENKATYGIKVANFSLHSGAVNRFYNDPLNRAVEKLWFNGVTVVAAAGNYGQAGAASGVRYAPGSDPFVITVGAVDIGGTTRVNDDSRAPWSAYGRTPDGFWKPEICASGRYMVGPIPMGSTLQLAKSASMRQPGYIELSGTSFSAPVVTGVAAQILARNPGFTPDQVKGALMHRARPVPQAAPLSCGVGQINAVQAGTARKAVNPNAAMNRFVVTDLETGMRAFDAVSWTDVSWTDVSWDAVSWDAVSWSDVSWDSVSWSDVSWSDVSWDAVSWSDVSWEDAAEQEVLDGDGYEATPPEEAEAVVDPDLQAIADPEAPVQAPEAPVEEPVAPVEEPAAPEAPAAPVEEPAAPVEETVAVVEAPVVPLSGL